MTDAFFQYYKLTLESMNCIDEESYTNILIELNYYWYLLSEDEKTASKKLTHLLIAVQFAKNWVQNEKIKTTLRNVLPDVNRNHQIQWHKLYNHYFIEDKSK